MTASDIVPWISLAVSLATPLAIFTGRNWLKARIEKGVQHGFDRKIEQMRADLRESEERLKSSLRDKEGEIATLRSTVLAGSSGRQALLDKRRFEAVEKVWTAVNDMGRLPAVVITRPLASSLWALCSRARIAAQRRNPLQRDFLT
ncbi:hypothetical protein [Bradyrhizobium sp. CCBAU 11386]|uniref:hypothetical protein n=1 Tax=Bradyrhizobium sp. CCBAU 11386 TaxID=1630837 RepID=UPI0023040A3B|nr:hypothetical protein [Bradyrhizobium sp. CCBAU 11386]